MSMIIRAVIKSCYNASFFMVFIFCMLISYNSWGEGPAHISLKTKTPQKLNLTVGKSLVIEYPKGVNRVSLAPQAPNEVAVLKTLKNVRQFILTGKAPGTTNLTFWENNRISAVFDVEVSPDISIIKEKLHEIFPEEKDVKVVAAHDTVTLSGTVSSAANLSKVLALAEAYAPGKVMNLVEVGGVHQVMLEVRIAEMSRSLTRRLGFNFNYISSSGRNVGLSMLNNLTSLPGGGAGFPEEPIGVSNAVNAIFRFFGEDTTWTVFIDALKEEGLLKVLAEPTLITLSGQTANFLAGGEFPIPIPQTGGTGTVTIEFKAFGVGLNFTPTVLSSGKINMKVAPEVSELDFSNAVSFGGFVVPGLTTRRVSTVIELADGQSFAIAGLLQDNVREIVSKFPVLGDIPILGALFRSSSFIKNETELIIIVTPHLVRPLDMAKQTLPTDQFIEPNDFEFYLLGGLEEKEKMESLGTTSSPPHLKKEEGLEGDFGHIIPE